MELPKELIEKVKRDEAREKKLRDKKRAQQQYNRRKLDKDVRDYIKRTKGPIRGSEIDAIARRHKNFFG